jgi:hypothetical protein
VGQKIIVSFLTFLNYFFAKKTFFNIKTGFLVVKCIVKYRDYVDCLFFNNLTNVCYSQKTEASYFKKNRLIW